jgi:hypothetical protein
MILDERNEFADATALSTAATGLALVGDVIDLGTDGVNDVEGMYLVVTVDTAVTSGGAATVEFQLASDAQAAIAVDGSATVHAKSAAIPKATLVAGYQAFVVALPKGQYERYLGILQNVGTAALTAGKVNAFLTNAPATWKSFDAPFQL